jgi:hypothetical protein
LLNSSPAWASNASSFPLLVSAQGLQLLFEQGLGVGAEFAKLGGRCVDGLAEALGRTRLSGCRRGHQRERQRDG